MIPPSWGKLGGIKGPAVEQVGTVFPIYGGCLGGPHWGLLQIPFPYVLYESRVGLCLCSLTVYAI